MATRQLSVTAEEIFPRNTQRKSWIISNEDASIPVYIKRERTATPSVSSTDHDHRIPAGGLLALNYSQDGREAITDRWAAVADSGTPRVSFFETEDIVR